MGSAGAIEMGDVADPPKRPSPHILPCRLWSFYVKGCTT